MKRLDRTKTHNQLLEDMEDKTKELGEERIKKPEKKDIDYEEKSREKEDKKDKKDKITKFEQFIINEGEGGGGVAYATAGNGYGMGAITAPIMSDTPGDMRGSTPGSGDIAATDKGKYFGEKPKKKKKKSTKKKRHEGTSETKEEMYVTSYKDWINTGM